VYFSKRLDFIFLSTNLTTYNNTKNQCFPVKFYDLSFLLLKNRCSKPILYFLYVDVTSLCMPFVKIGLFLIFLFPVFHGVKMPEKEEDC